MGRVTLRRSAPLLGEPDGHRSSLLAATLARGARHDKVGGSGTWPFLAKRYIEADIALHVHGYSGAGHNAEPCDFCLTFECAVRDTDLLKSTRGCAWREVVETCFGKDASQVDKLVPVEVGQTVEQPKRVVVRLTVPSLKRLLVLDDCLMVASQETHSFDNAVSQISSGWMPKHGAVDKDRKLGLFVDDLPVITRKFTGGVIEGGSLMVEDFADKRAASGRSARERLHDQIAELSLHILDNTVSVALEEPLDCAIEFLEVTSGPVQFVELHE